MRKLTLLIGVVLTIFLITAGCDSQLTDSESSENIISSETTTAVDGKGKAKGQGKGNPTVGTKVGPGKVVVGTDVSVWDSSIEQDEENGIYPIGGSGQVNGEFTTAERNGIQIGLRAQKRFEGTIEANGNRVGVYESETGFSSGTRAVWNYDWHVDLRGAKGKYAGKTLEDFDLTLETNIAPSLFGFPVPLDLTFGGAIAQNAVLYQSSQNPDFGNDVFDATVEDTYTFRLVLTPKTFNGPPLATAIEVNVTD